MTSNVKTIMNLLASVIAFSMCVSMWTSGADVRPLEGFAAGSFIEALCYAILAFVTAGSGGAFHYFARQFLADGKRGSDAKAR